MRTETYILPSHWGYALMYADLSGFDDDEEAQIAAWEADHPGRLLVSMDDADEFAWRHDATAYGALAGAVHRCTFHVLPGYGEIGADEALEDVL